MDVKYFINKFGAIPEENWCTEFLSTKDGRACANGHCNVKGTTWAFFNPHIMNFSPIFTLTDESKALQKVFSRLKVHYMPNLTIVGAVTDGWHTGKSPEYSTIAAEINNGLTVEYQQETPKQRILAALRDIELLEEQDRAVEQTNKIMQTENLLEEALDSW